MMKKTLGLMTLLALLLAGYQSPVRAMAPTVDDPGSLIVGDDEDGPTNNVFVYPSAFSLVGIGNDDNTPPANLIWSYTGTGKYLLNGVQPNGGDPVNPLVAVQVQANDNDTSTVGQDASADTVTIRNDTLSSLSGGPTYPDPAGGPGILASETQTITLIASDGSLAGFRTITLYTEDDGPDAVSGGGLIPEIDQDFENNGPQGWSGQVIAGSATTGTATGLCMGVPTGTHTVAWYSPNYFTVGGPGYVTLVQYAFWQTTMTMWCSQTTVGLIPFWDVVYHNFYPSNPLNTQGNQYGGEFWEWSSSGGASGIMTPNGRTDFLYLMCPNAQMTQQWNGLLTGDGGFSALQTPYNPVNDGHNDWNMFFRILNGNTSIGGQNDTGTICLRRIQVHRGNMQTINKTLLYGPAINSSTHRIYPDALGNPGGSAGSNIDNVNAVANFFLSGNGTSDLAGARKQLTWFDSTQTDPNLQLFPVDWLSDKNYMCEAKVRSNVGGGAGPEGTDPVDLIFITHDCPTSEHGGYHYTQKGRVAGGTGMRFAASPRLASSTGGVVQSYVGLAHSANRSASATLTNRRFRFRPDFWNTGTSPGIGDRKSVV